MSEINAVGHRVLHGGEKFSESVLVTPEVEAAIEYFDTNNSTAFKTWLNTLDEGSGRKPLDVDYRGYLRNATNIWPGSYEYGATK